MAASTTPRSSSEREDPQLDADELDRIEAERASDEEERDEERGDRHDGATSEHAAEQADGDHRDEVVDPGDRVQEALLERCREVEARVVRGRGVREYEDEQAGAGKRRAGESS